MNIDLEMFKGELSVVDQDAGRYFLVIEYFDNGAPGMDVFDRYGEEFDSFKTWFDLEDDQDPHEVMNSIV